LTGGRLGLQVEWPKSEETHVPSLELLFHHKSYFFFRATATLSLLSRGES